MTSMLHPFWTPALADAFAPVLDAQHHGREAIRTAYNALSDDHRIDLVTMVQAGRVPMLATSAHVLPVLSPQGCQAILDRSADYAWAENVEEEESYRMREAVLGDADPDYATFLRGVLMTGASPWMQMIWGRLPSQLASIQLAQYSADDRSEGSPHIDRDSSYTVVINLNPDEYEGGGIILRDGLVGDFVIPKLPQGFGLFYDGQRTIHCGAKVTSGTKCILVLWCNQENDCW